MVAGWLVALMGLIGMVVPVETDSTPPVRCQGIAIAVAFRDSPEVADGESCRDAGRSLLFGGVMFMAVGTAAALAGRSWRRRHRRAVVDPPVVGCSFPFAKMLVGHRRAVAVVGPRDLALRDLPLVRNPFVVPLDQVAAVVVLPSLEPDREPVWSRDVRRLDLTSSRVHPSTIVVVFREPQRIGPFTFGAGQELALTRRERIGGVAVDLIGVGVVDPVDFSRALAAAGVPVASSVQAEVARVVGVAGEYEVAARLHTVRRRRIAVTARVGIMAVAFVCLLGARLGLGLGDEGSGGGGVVAVIISALVWMVLAAAAALLAMVWSRRRKHRSHTPTSLRSPRSAYAVELAVVVGSVAVPLFVVWLIRNTDLSSTVAYGMIAGVPGGLILAVALRNWL